MVPFLKGTSVQTFSSCPLRTRKKDASKGGMVFYASALRHIQQNLFIKNTFFLKS